MTFILNFHGLGECKRSFEDGEEPYWISTDRFEQCLDIAAKNPVPVQFTFDDGNASDREIALPILQQRGLSADFFVLVGRIGQRGYLTEKQLRQISDCAQMCIGSHGMDHVSWPELDDGALERELGESKRILEEICGYPIEKAGLPFGRYNARVIEQLRRHGYTMIYSSDGGPKLSDKPPIPRFSARMDTTLEGLEAVMKRSSLLAKSKSELRAFIKSHR